MMRPTRFQIAKPDIVNYFNEIPQRVLTIKDLARILQDQRRFWRLPLSMSLRQFATTLNEKADLITVQLRQADGRNLTRYSWGEVPPFEIALSLRPRSYLCHYTALHLHHLTEQIPKTIYANFEQRPHVQIDVRLDQDRIDAAFARPVRVTQNIFTYRNLKICLLNGKYTGQLGVTDVRTENGRATLRVTDLERTLIDCSVRPVYAGGVFQVLDAFKAARERISVNRLAATLKKMEFIYPYHQVIGFYLERTGYAESVLSLLQKFGFEHDFYLTHEMKEVVYSKRWHLYFPKSME